MSDTFPSSHSRRRFLREVLAWSAAATLPSFAAAPSAKRKHKDAAHALILGDWGWLDVTGPDDARGGKGFAAQSQVAQGMQHYARGEQLTPDALFLLGDAWYGDLPGGAHSPRWKTQFEQMYPVESFPGPAYSMLGNHDYQFLPASVNKVEAELEYARVGVGLDGKPTRWTMPSHWYTFDFPARKPLLHCIVLDSNVPAADGLPRHGVNFTLTAQQYAEQLHWLEGELSKPRTTPFLAVLGHHPVYSNGPHGDHATLVRDWDPLFRKYKVDLYMAGHDHDLQILQFADHPTTHFLSGGGGADLYALKIDDFARGPYAQEVHGFSHLSVSGEELTLRHMDASGRPLFGVVRNAKGEVRSLKTSA